jgi:dTDP-4-dehydrorhamnose 3,5-epimerase
VIFTTLPLKGALIVEPERHEDARGFFARTWCQREFEANGLDGHLVQCSVSFNPRKGTLRGLHYQTAPAEETKLVRCTMGAIYDVIVDLRPDSPTFTEHCATVLTADNRTMVYIPAGFAHGFQTLVPNTEVFYQMSAFHDPAHAAGVRWNDPAFAIRWPADDRLMSERDASYPDFARER